jgi:hypothetical protein
MYQKPPTEDLRRYAASLFARRDGAQIIQYKEIEIGDDNALPRNCHNNADSWVENHPEFSVVRGWLVVVIPGFQWIRFLAHSVVSSADGELFDITPQRAFQQHPFLPANVPEVTYKKYEQMLFVAFGSSILDHSHGNM